MPVRCVLLVNPAAGKGRAAVAARSVADLLRSVCDVQLVLARDPAGTAELARQAVAAEADVLVVLGGDGAAHAAVQACAGSATALGLVPAGSGNDLARALGVPADPVRAARALARAVERGRQARMDLGRIAGGNWFATVLCAGFDSAVNARVNRMRWPRGRRRYDLAILAELARLRAMPLRIETESELVEQPATLVAVGNTAWYGGGVEICPTADPADGKFDVTVVGEVDRRDLLGILPGLRTGRHVAHPAVRTLRAASLRLGGDNGWFAHADGELQARLPLTVTCSPGVLRVVDVTAGGATPERSG